MRGTRWPFSAGIRLSLTLSCVAAVSVLVSLDRLTAHPQGGPAPVQQPPTFRTAASFVQVDVYPTAAGTSVPDLSKEDFEIFEDDVLQTVATFEHVSARRVEGVARSEPRTLAESRALAEDPRNRLFVLYLDTYHVTDPQRIHDGRLWAPRAPDGRRPPEKRKPLGPQAIDKGIVSFLERAIGPNDLVAPMSPELDARQMVFTRRPERFADWVSTTWGRRFSWDDLSPEEENWATCYPPDDVGDPFGCFAGIFEEMVLRHREELTLESLRATVDQLGRVREGRKAVLLVSEGWRLYRRNERLARAVPRVSAVGCPQQPPPPPQVSVGPDGRLRVGSEQQDGLNTNYHACGTARLALSELDDESELRRLFDWANRQNVSFYPVDPRGLAVFDTPIDATSPGRMNAGAAALPSPVEDGNALRGRLGALRDLATATDGFVTETNDFAAGMKRIADDLSEYYLIGYNSTNAKLDGRFRKITVRVKRSGVQVRSRRGYLAATEKEVAASAAAAAPPDPALRARELALGTLTNATLDRTVRLAAGYEWRTGPGPVSASVWAAAELGESAPRRVEWQNGGEAVVTLSAADGREVASGRGQLSSSARTFTWSTASQPIEPGDYLVRVSVRPAAGGEVPATDQVRVAVPAAPLSGLPGAATPRVLRRGPSTGAAHVQTADARFRRVERLRVIVSVARQPGPVAARLLDRRGQALAVPVNAVTEEIRGQAAVQADATLASLAPGDYLVEISLGGDAAGQIVLVPFKIVP